MHVCCVVFVTCQPTQVNTPRLIKYEYEYYTIRSYETFIRVGRERFVMSAVEHSNERSQQCFNVFTAVVAELHQEMKQFQHLQYYIHVGSTVNRS